MCELLQGFPAGEGRGDVNGTMTFLQLREENSLCLPASHHQDQSNLLDHGQILSRSQLCPQTLHEHLEILIGVN